MHPAVHVRIASDGRTEWTDAAGHRHRLTGPAVIHADGTEEWHLDGVAHRDDGPAFVSDTLGQHWFQHGFYHRLDGPAIEAQPGELDSWYVNGRWVSEKPEDCAALEDLRRERPDLLPHVLALCTADGPRAVDLVPAVVAAHS